MWKISFKTITVNGIMVHSTGANNPNLKRYVGPDDGLLGKNQYNNHWNQDTPDGRKVCVHAFIGKLADGSVATYQTLPWNMEGWHGGSGTKGRVNDTHIGFEICEDGLTRYISTPCTGKRLNYALTFVKCIASTRWLTVLSSGITKDICAVLPPIMATRTIGFRNTANLWTRSAPMSRNYYRQTNRRILPHPLRHRPHRNHYIAFKLARIR